MVTPHYAAAKIRIHGQRKSNNENLSFHEKNDDQAMIRI